MATSKPSLPKGTRDFGPKEAARRAYLMEVIRKNFVKYGFSQIETPAMEQLSVLTGKYGDEGDQLLFKILNSGDFLKDTTSADYQQGAGQLLGKIAEKGLRYDLTVPFARYVVQHQHELTFPFRRFQMQPVWRADRPQKGRYREFYQCDADIIGSDSLWNEAELTMLIHDVFQDLGYQGFVIKINHRDILNQLAAYAGLQGKEMPFCITIDKLDKIGQEKVTEELIQLGADTHRLEKVLGHFGREESPEQLLDTLSALVGNTTGSNELQEYFDLLKAYQPESELKIILDFSLARGLTYYTGMIFEVKATDVAIGSITGGGRYDNLTGVFGLEGVSGVGISFGLDRIYDVLEEKGLFPENLSTTTELLVAHLDDQGRHHGASLLRELRLAGIRAELFPDITKIKKQFNYADKKNIPYVMVIGQDEIAQKKYSLKNMQSGKQELLDLSALINLLRSE